MSPPTWAKDAICAWFLAHSTGVNYTYDAAGNLTGTTAGDSYSYDPWGHLTEDTLDGTITTAAFDATSTRVEVDGVDQLWDRTGYGTLISTGAGDNFLHMPGGGVLREDDSWLLRDAIGSVRDVTDTTGAVTASSAYTEILSEYAKALRDAGSIQTNELYAGGS